MAVGWVPFLRRLARATLVSYAQILFSNRPLPGLLFLAASFAAEPFTGLVGLVATAAANLTALRVWHDRIRWELGLAGYNAVLLGLALGYYLPHTRVVFLLAIAGGAVSALATEWLSHRFARHSLPVMGLPFLVFAWVVITFAGSGHPPAHFFRVDPLAAYVPGFVSSTLRVFGSAFFSKSVLSGLLVLAGLLVASRISAAVVLGGALVVTLLTASRPVPELSINLAIVPVGLVFYLAPSRRLFWQVPAGVALTVLLALALDAVVGVTHLPYLILPLTVTLFAVLLLGKARALGVELVPMAMLRSPEDNIRLYLKRQRPQLRLPFFGTWFVSQGVDGGETHKDRLAFAWDFMVRDERGRTFGTPGYRLTDYHAYGLLACAPAPGRVVAVEDGVADNPPGRMNKEQNWGNYVIVEHSFLEFSILAHLQQGSVRVRVGDKVQAGAVVGLCGNSGYSGQPHLHYQLQAGPVPGSDAVPAEFHNYLVLGGAPAPQVPDSRFRTPEGFPRSERGGTERFLRVGRPEQGQTLQPMLPQESVRQLVLATFDTEACFAVRRGTAAAVSESWTAKKDSNTITVRSGASVVVVTETREGLEIERVRGGAMLGRTFEGIGFIPFYSRPGLEFEAGAWRHSFGRREPLPEGGDGLLLESRSLRVTRRIWFTEGKGVTRVEWGRGMQRITATRTQDKGPGVRA